MVNVIMGAAYNKENIFKIRKLPNFELNESEYFEFIFYYYFNNLNNICHIVFHSYYLFYNIIIN